MIRKVFVWGLITVLLVLDWLALDDITTGNEPNLIGEYVFLFFSLFIFLFLFLKFRKGK